MAKTREEELEEARKRYEEHLSTKPTQYTSPYSKEVESLYEQISQRKPFTYNFNADALYQQNKDRLMQQGKLAMQDAMGQAAAMTGGYGNSYAQTVGNQVYQGYMQQENDMIPELYQMAYDRYTREGADLYDRYNAAVSRENENYGRYLDDVAMWQNESDRLASRYDTLREFDEEYGDIVDEPGTITGAPEAASIVQKALLAGASTNEIMSALRDALEKGKRGEKGGITQAEYNDIVTTFLPQRHIGIPGLR